MVVCYCLLLLVFLVVLTSGYQRLGFCKRPCAFGGMVIARLQSKAGEASLFVRKYNASKIAGLYTFLLAWSSFKAINNGSLAIPDEFVVPSMHPWPAECWGLKLANKAANIRAGRIYNKPNELLLLNGVGFEWDPAGLNFEKVMSSLEVYREQHGNVPIPKSFKVPSTAPYPRNTWGTKLGLLVRNFRYRGDYAQHRDRFAALGVTQDKVGIDTRHWDYLYRALVMYKSTYGDVKIPRKWVVPSEDPWPAESWGMKLGYRVHNIVHRGDYILSNSTRSELAADLGIYYRS